MGKYFNNSKCKSTFVGWDLCVWNVRGEEGLRSVIFLHVSNLSFRTYLVCKVNSMDISIVLIDRMSKLVGPDIGLAKDMRIVKGRNGGWGKRVADSGENLGK